MRCFDSSLRVVRIDQVDQDLLRKLIERGETERGAIGLRARDLGRKTAVQAPSLTVKPNHQLDVRTFGQKEIGFNKCTLKTNVSEGTLS